MGYVSALLALLGGCSSSLSFSGSTFPGRRAFERKLATSATLEFDQKSRRPEQTACRRGCFSNAESYMDWACKKGCSLSETIRWRDSSRPGDRGLVAASKISADDIVASIPKELSIMTDASDGWEGRLTNQTLAARFQSDAEEHGIIALRPWIQSWQEGGWATKLQGSPHPGMTIDEGDFGNVIGGSFLTTGSDLDVEIYRKFGLPCHPVIDRAAIRLSAMTGASKPAARAALEARHHAFRACRDAEFLVDLSDVAESSKGSLRERRLQQVARYFSLTVARAAAFAEHIVVLPFHELLEHDQDENILVSMTGDSINLVAKADINEGEPLTRDYSAAPRLRDAPQPLATPTGGSRTRPPNEDDSDLQLLLNSGLPLWDLRLGAFRSA